MKQLVYVRSLKGTHFTGAILQNAAEEENIVVGGERFAGIIRSVTIQSKDNLIWEVHFWHKDTFTSTDVDADKFAGAVKWTAITQGVQLGATGQYYYVNHDLYVPYSDQDGTGELHLALVNKSAGAKTAGANGQVVIEVGIEVTG